MLVLRRKTGERIAIDGGIEVTVLEAWEDTVKLGICAPQEVGIRRAELPPRSSADVGAQRRTTGRRSSG